MNTTARTDEPQGVNFFVSYTGRDANWATWVAWELERAGFTYRMQADHFPPGSRFIREMRRWLQSADHLIAILSPAYFDSPFASLEINSTVAADPLGTARRVIPVRVAKCEIPTMFSDLVYIDLVDKAEDEARRALIAGVRAARVGSHAVSRKVKERPKWPAATVASNVTGQTRVSNVQERDDLPVRIQFLACDVGRGLDLKGQHAALNTVIKASRFSRQLQLKAEFDVTDANLFTKLNSYRPHVVHISGNQNGGDVLLPASDGGEVVVPDEALAGLLSSLGRGVRLAIIDTCKSYTCAKRVSDVVECAIGVEDDIFDNEAIRFYEVFYEALAAGHCVADAHGQAVAALLFMKVPPKRIPKLCEKEKGSASRMFMVGQ